MEYTFEESCTAVKPYITSLLKKFEEDLRNGVFLGDESQFIKSKHQIELLSTIRTTVFNTVEEE